MMKAVDVKIPAEDTETSALIDTKGRCATGNIPRLLASLFGLLSLLVTPQAVAEDPVSEDWQFQIAPYVWALAAEGDATVKGRTFDVDLSFKDIVEELNYGVMLQGEARKGRVGAIVNVLYANLGDETNVGPLEIDPDANLFWGGFGGYYRLGPPGTWIVRRGTTARS